jgi:hypothetical protein
LLIKIMPNVSPNILLKKEQFLFCKKTLIMIFFSYTDVIHILHVLNDNLFVISWWMCFSGDNRHSYGLQLRSSLQTCSFISMKQTPYRCCSWTMKKKLARSFRFTFRYINDVLSMDNSEFVDYIDQIFPFEL